jgi:hypothetical protein
MRSVWLALVLCLVVGLVTDAPHAASEPQGMWVGQGHAVRTADLKLVTITTEYSSEFWFVASKSTTVGPVPVTGDATVSYNLSFSDGRLRTLIGFAHWGVSRAGALIPSISGISGIEQLFTSAVSTRDLLGMRMAYREFAPVRRGQIVGTIDQGVIRLRWLAAPKPIPYQEYAVRPLTEEPTKTGAQPAYPPWLADAMISEPVPGHLIAMTTAEASSYHKDEVSISAIWSAHRVN